MKKKYLRLSLISVVFIFILILLFSKEIEVICYSLLTGDQIDYYEASNHSLIAVNEDADSTTYHIFLKRKNSVLKDNHFSYKVSNDSISKMLDTIPEYYDSYTIIYDQPYLRKWTANLTNKSLEENLYYAVSISNEKQENIVFEFSFFSDEILLFDGYETIKIR